MKTPSKNKILIKSVNIKVLHLLGPVGDE